MQLRSSLHHFCKKSTEALPTPPSPSVLTFHSYTASATYFCKCACKGNSTIIALNPKTSSSSSSSTSPNLFRRDRTQAEDPTILKSKDDGDESPKSQHAKTCNDCNRELCLSHNLPRCKGVKEEEIFTTCFRTWLPSLPASGIPWLPLSSPSHRP